MSARLSPGLTAAALDRPRPVSDWIPILAVLLAAGVVALLCHEIPSRLPIWAPYEFSWTEFVALALTSVWYGIGVLRMIPAERPSIARQIAFGTGMALIYGVLQTRFDYMAQHMFFLSRVQHLILHHFGPFLIALAWPGAALHRGMPEALRRMVSSPALGRVIYRLQQPFLAAFLFVAVIDVWLIPAINFRAMLNPTLYTVMSWSMVVDGVFFWLLIFDPTGAPVARTSFAVRLLVVVLVMFPQVAVGSYLTFTTQDLYPFYELCGRLYPSIDAILDQHYGGLIVWIPASMMSSVAFLLTLNHLRRTEDNRPIATMTDQERRMAELSSRWTGR